MTLYEVLTVCTMQLFTCKVTLHYYMHIWHLASCVYVDIPLEALFHIYTALEKPNKFLQNYYDLLIQHLKLKVLITWLIFLQTKMELSPVLTLWQHPTFTVSPHFWASLFNHARLMSTRHSVRWWLITQWPFRRWSLPSYCTTRLLNRLSFHEVLARPISLSHGWCHL